MAPWNQLGCLRRRKRAAVLALRQGAAVAALDGRKVEVGGWFWFLEPPRQKGVKAPPRSVDVEALRLALSARIGESVSVDAVDRQQGARARLVTEEPARVLTVMASVAGELGTELNAGVSDVDPMAHLLRRLIADVSA